MLLEMKAVASLRHPMPSGVQPFWDYAVIVIFSAANHGDEGAAEALAQIANLDASAMSL